MWSNDLLVEIRDILQNLPANISAEWSRNPVNTPDDRADPEEGPAPAKLEVPDEFYQQLTALKDSLVESTASFAANLQNVLPGLSSLGEQTSSVIVEAVTRAMEDGGKSIQDALASAAQSISASFADQIAQATGGAQAAPQPQVGAAPDSLQGAVSALQQAVANQQIIGKVSTDALQNAVIAMQQGVASQQQQMASFVNQLHGVASSFQQAAPPPRQAPQPTQQSGAAGQTAEDVLRGIMKSASASEAAQIAAARQLAAIDETAQFMGEVRSALEGIIQSTGARDQSRISATRALEHVEKVYERREQRAQPEPEAGGEVVGRIRAAFHSLSSLVSRFVPEFGGIFQSFGTIFNTVASAAGKIMPGVVRSAAAAGAGGSGGGIGAGVAAAAGGVGGGGVGPAAGALAGISSSASGASAALASLATPITAAIAAVVAIGAAAVLVPHALRKAADSLLDSQRQFAMMSGSLMSAFVSYDVQQFMRNISFAKQTTGSTRELLQAQSGLRQALLPQEVAWTNMKNRVMARWAEALTPVAEAVTPLVEGGASALTWWMSNFWIGLGPLGWIGKGAWELTNLITGHDEEEEKRKKAQQQKENEQLFFVEAFNSLGLHSGRGGFQPPHVFPVNP